MADRLQFQGTDLGEPQALRRNLALARLRWFIAFGWHVLEAGDYVHGRHIELLCDELEAINFGRSNRLAVNLPPSHMKSLLLAVYWPAWTWLQDNQHLAGNWVRFMFITHSEDLAHRDSRRCRQLVTSEWYQELAAGSVRVSRDEGQIATWGLSGAGGGRQCYAIEGRITGQKADCIVIDDPHDVIKVHSAQHRKVAKDLHNESLPSRVRDPERNAFVYCGQRSHPDDLFGYVLKQQASGRLAKPFKHICLPGEFDPNHPHPCAQDWRTEPGEVLWPERFGAQELRELVKTNYGRQSQIQQAPQSRAGSLFRDVSWRIVDDYPRDVAFLRYWDLAASSIDDEGSTDPDYSAGAKLAFDEDGITYLIDMQRGRWGPAELEARMKFVARETDGRAVPVVIEQEPGAAGKHLISHIQRHVLPGYDVTGDPATGAALVAVMPMIAAAEAGNFRLVRARWNETFIAECEEYTGEGASHDDQVIAAAKGYVQLTTMLSIDSLVW